MLKSCWFHADFIFSLNCTMFCTTIEIRLVLNSCWVHADFMLISFSPEIFTMLCATLCITMVLNSCWIHAEFKQFRENREKVFLQFVTIWHLKHPRLDYSCYIVYSMNNPVWDASNATLKVYKFRYFSRFCLNSAWIQHEFNMNSTPLLCKVLHKALWKLRWKWNQHEISMNSTWTQHHCYAKCCAKHCENLRWKWSQHENSMNSAWIRHEFNTSLILPHVFGDGKL